MEELSTQEAFSKMVTHLRTQGVKSMDGKNGCVYRGPNGLMCAVGCLIPDDKYYPMMEYKPLSHIFKGWERRTQELLSDVQVVHDGCAPSKWEEKLHQVAGEYGLTMPT